MLDTSSIPTPIMKWLKRNMKDIRNADVRKWIEHLPHHTVKHLDEMMKHYKGGKLSFMKAHKKAMDKVGK